MTRAARVGQHLLLWSWALLTLLCIGGAQLARELDGNFAGGAITIRDWMRFYNAVLLTNHAVLLLACLVGVLLSADPRDDRPARVARLASAGCFGGALLLCGAMLAFPLWAGSGPFTPGSTPVRLLRVLVFAPLVLRTLGWGLFVAAFARSLGEHQPAVRACARVLLVLVGADLVVGIWKWAATPRAVIALLHPLATEPRPLAAWVFASLLFLLLFGARLFGRSPRTS
jgi:hypothetical protein